MPHPLKLIEEIKQLLYKTYPESSHTFIIEKSLSKFGMRLIPDIQVFRNKKLICIVEIGYTRPEKLKEYKRLDVPDIRWYSKKGELINPYYKTEVIIREYRVNELDLWHGIVIDYHNFWNTAETCYDCWKDCYDSHIRRGYSDIDAIDESDSEIYDFYGEVWTNSDVHFLAYFCDHCGGNYLRGDLDNMGIWVPYGANDYVSLDTYGDFLRYRARKIRQMRFEKIGKELRECSYSFVDLSKHIVKVFGEELYYDQFGKWMPEKRRE